MAFEDELGVGAMYPGCDEKLLRSLLTSCPAVNGVTPGVLNDANSSACDGFVNWVPVESLVGLCDHVLGYSTEKPFEVHILLQNVKPVSGVGVGVSVGDGDGVGDGLGLGTTVGVGILVAVAFW